MSRHTLRAVFARSFFKYTLPYVLIIAAFIWGLIFLIDYASQKPPPGKQATPARVCRVVELRIDRDLKVCTTHGDPEPDPRAPETQAGLCFLKIGCPLPTASPTPSPTPTTSTAFACVTGEQKGVQLVYGHPSDRPDVISSWRSTILSIASRMDRELAGRRVRWVCSAGQPTIWRVTLPAVGADNSFTFAEYIRGVKNAGGNQPGRAYLGFVSGIEREYKYGGQATLWDDDRNAVNNANNSGPSWSMVDHLSWAGALHELGHNLGAVQCSAPHSTCKPNDTGQHHCWDENDIMCYADGTRHAMVRVCDVSVPLFDCRRDDYYNTAPASGSYLSNHWNVGRSAFLVAA